MQGNVGDVPLYRTCGHRYQGPAMSSASGAPPCWCGLDSIGSCTKCGQRLCNDHAFRRDGRILCGDDSSAFDEAKREEDRAKAREYAAAEEKWMSDWERQAAAALETVTDRVERGVRLLAAGLPRVYTPELSALLQEATTLEVADIAAWFLRMVTSEPEQVYQWERHWLTGSPKRKAVLGWRFRARPRWKGQTSGGPMTILTDGRVVPGDAEVAISDEFFASDSLREMLKMVSARPLGLAKRPYREEEHRFGPDYDSKANREALMGLTIP